MKNSKKSVYLLIQPHSDDVLLSCSFMLFTPKNYGLVEVLTVENDSKRILEDKNLYSFLGVPFHHLNVPFIDNSYYGYHKAYKGVNHTDSMKYLYDYFGEETLLKIKEGVESFIENWVSKKLIDGFNPAIYAPWGIGHPFHNFINSVIFEFSENNPFPAYYYYREFPHSYKKRSAEQVKQNQLAYELNSSNNVEAFADIKWKLAKKFYKTQSGLLWYEKKYIEKNLPEEIYVYKQLPF